MSYIAELRSRYPSLDAYSDDEIIPFLPQIAPNKFAGLKGEQLTYAATTDDSQFTKGLKAGVDQVQAIGGGLLALSGDYAGAESVKEKGLDIYQSNMDEAAKYRPESTFTEIDGVGDALDWAGYTLGNLAPTMATAVAGGGVGGIVGKKAAQSAAANLIKSELAKGVGKEAAIKAAGELIAKRIATGQGLGAYIASAGMETGSIYGDTEDANVSAIHGAVAGAFDALPVARVLGKFGIAGAAKNEITGNVVARIAKEGLKQSAFEGGTEGLQTLVEQHAKYWVENNGASLLQNLGDVGWNEVIEATAAGALGGFAMGGPTGALSRPGDQNKLSEAGKKTVDEEILKQTTENISQAENIDEAIGAATRGVNAVTPDTQTAQDLGVSFPDNSYLQDQIDIQGVKAGTTPDQRHTASMAGIDGLIISARRLGFADEEAKLTTAKRLYTQYKQALDEGNGQLADRYLEQGNKLYRDATGETGLGQPETRQYVDQFPVPYVFQGEVTGGQLTPFGGPNFTMREPDVDSSATTLDVGNRLLEDQGRRIGSEGMIYGTKPPRDFTPVPPNDSGVGQNIVDRMQSNPNRIEAQPGYQGRQVSNRDISTVSRTPVTVWTGSQGDGYQTENGAKLAKIGRERAQPELQWTITERPDGRFEVAGYDLNQETDFRPNVNTRAEITGGVNAEKGGVQQNQEVTEPLSRVSASINETTEIPGLSKEESAQVAERASTLTPDKFAGWARGRFGNDTEKQRAAMAFVSNESTQAQERVEGSDIRGENIDSEFTAFTPESGTLNVPRSEMPQVKAEHRGALANFLKARGIKGEDKTVPSASLKPTQKEFAEAKVQKAKEYKGGDRAILASSDGHILDGHHQWMAKRDGGEDVRIIQLDAPIRTLLSEIKEFPSVEQSQESGTVQQSSNTSSETIQNEVKLKSDGKPFPTEKAAKASLPFRKNPGAEVVAVDGGFGVSINNGRPQSVDKGQKSTATEEIVGRENSPQPDIKPDAKAENLAQSVEKQEDVEQKNDAQLDDFGEKLGGARKDQVRIPAMDKELSDDDIANSTMSKIFPKAEIDAIEDINAASFAKAARDEIPNKPRKSYRLSRWVDQVKTIRSLTSEYMQNPEKVEQEMRSPKWKPLKNWVAKIDVLRAIDRTQWDRIGKVAEYPDAYRYNRDDEGKTTADKEPSPHVNVEIDGNTKRFDGKSVADVVDKVRDALSNNADAKGLQFEIRGYKARNEWFIVKTGDKEYRQLKSFTGKNALSEAREYLKQNQAELENVWGEIKDRDNVRKDEVRNAENKPRIGKDYRNGKDVTPDMFTDTFGFRGVEFGNWVKQGKNAKERQGMLNQAFDAMMDLSDILDIPPKAISLNGTLGLGFGSRGSGKASAHFETGNVVINLTKTRGAGTFAHEWFHALDNYFSRKRGDKDFTGNNQAFREGSYITYKPEPMMVLKNAGNAYAALTKAELQRRSEMYGNSGLYALDRWEQDPNHPEGVRPVVEKAFADLVETLDQSPMKKRASAIDKGKADGYWSRIIERAARSFENYIITKIHNEGYDNDYLANVKAWEDWGNKNPERYPYLKPDEIAPIEKAFDTLFDTIESRETDSGVDLYSKGTNTSRNLTRTALASEIDKAFGKNFTQALEKSGLFKMVSRDEVPEVIEDVKYSGSGSILGFVKNGVAHLVYDNIGKGDSIKGLVNHEVGVHVMRLGRDSKEFQSILKQVEFMRKGNEKVKAAFRRVPKDTKPENVTEEALSYLIEDNSNISVVKKFLAWFREQIRKLGQSIKGAERFAFIRWANSLNENDLVRMATQATRRAVNPEVDVAANDGVMASKSKPQTETAAFKKWFGNSKVVDENGEPLVVYHGSPKSYITVFKPGEKSQGLYFSPEPALASIYAKDILSRSSGDVSPTVYPVYISLQNPIVIDSKKGVIKKAKRLLAKWQGKEAEYLSNNRDSSSAFFTKDEIEFMESQGYDGVINRDLMEIVVFNPTQIKSATGNNGDFDPSNPNILYSRSEGESGFAIPDETLTTVAIRKIQDKFKVLKDLEKNIKQSGGTITEENDAYLAEELFHGKAENDLRLMREQYVEPLAKKMAEFGIERAELDKYLYAKHAPERNKQIAKINPDMPDGGSGMTNREAADIVAEVRQSGKQEQYDQLAGIVYDMLQVQRDLIREGGLEDDGTLDAWESAYKHYVPLKGWAEDTKDQGIPGTGKGFNIRGKESQRALGRSTEAASPTAYAITDLTEKLIRKRKNEVGNALLKLIQDNPNPEYWEVFTDENPETDRRIVKVRDEETGEMVDQVRETNIPMAIMKDRYFTTKKDGKTYYMKLADERLMKAMKNIGPETNNGLIRTLAAINRLLSSLNTSYAPEFVISNFARDIQTAVLNLQAEQSAEEGKAYGVKIARKTVKDVPKAMRAIYASLRGKTLNGNAGTWQRHFDEFREAGAKTGWFDMKDLNGQMKDIENLVDMAKGGVKGNALKWMKSSAEVVENLNSAVENAVRLSAYVNARKAGISQARAASLAKTLTVNFNKKGELGTLLNALYMFANASTQGVANFARTMGTLKGDKSLRWSNLNNAQKIAVGLVAGSYFLAMINRSGAGDDDDGENFYDKVPDYVKERNLVIMKSLFGGEKGEYWKIPLPYGYNIFHVLGDGMESVFTGNKSAAEAATDFGLATLGSFSPIGFQDSDSVEGLFLKNAAPTVIKPIVDIAMNENFMGSTIYNENFPFGTPKPDSSLARRSTPEAYKKLAEWLNDVSGGSQYRSGAVDINPDVLNYIVDYVGGSAYSFFGTKMPDAITRSMAGIEMEPHKTPFLSRVSGKVLPYEDMDKFYQRRDEIGQIQAEMKSLSGIERVQFAREYKDKLQLKGLIKSTENQLKILRKQRDRIYEQDVPLKERDTKLKEIEQRMKKVIDKFNKEYATAA